MLFLEYLIDKKHLDNPVDNCTFYTNLSHYGGGGEGVWNLPSSFIPLLHWLVIWYILLNFQRAAGMGSYIAPRKRKMETLLPESYKAGEDVEVIKKRAKLDQDAEGDTKMD